MSNKRKAIDRTLKAITYLSSLMAVAILLLIIGFVMKNGLSLLNLDLITSDFHAKYYNGKAEDNLPFIEYSRPSSLEDNEYFSSKWGIALKDETDLQGKNMIVVTYVDKNSPMLTMIDVNNEGVSLELQKDHVINSIKFYNAPSALSIFGAEEMIRSLDQQDQIREIVFLSEGGGIRGSLITTLCTIGFSILFALPIGIASAIYLNEFAKDNRFTRIIRTMIETLIGVPSIIFGLMGLAVFVPLTIKYTPATSANILSGSLTLAVILLPIIIRSTEESLKNVPIDFRYASLGLGANHTQTTMKVVLPSAFPGILTATLLAIGRVIGESAALIFAIGTTIKDDISIYGRSTTLSVHIWSLMTDEPANVQLASTISLVILIIVLILNISIKLISRLYMRKVY